MAAPRRGGGASEFAPGARNFCDLESDPEYCINKQ